jgi:hypothetical protein
MLNVHRQLVVRSGFCPNLVLQVTLCYFVCIHKWWSVRIVIANNAFSILSLIREQNVRLNF